MDTVKNDLLGLVNKVRNHKRQPLLSRLDDDARLREDLHFDSLDLAELTVRIEEKFGVDVFEAGVVARWGDVEQRVIQHVRRSA